MKLTLHLATGNAHKVRELTALARRHPVILPPATGPSASVDLELVVPGLLPAVVEDAGTYVGNARKKAAALRELLAPDAWVLADDSGLGVDALGGAPGVESAYFAGPQADWKANLQKLIGAMREVPDGQRQAHFHCVLVLLGPGGAQQIFEGRCDGNLAREPGGAGGFGYDPLFIPSGWNCTYAVLTEDQKNGISHRARAWFALVEWLSQRLRLN